LRVPARLEAGQAFTIPTEGSGQATFYLVGPDHVVKRGVQLGSEIQIPSADVEAAGRYQAILCGDTCTSTTFDVQPSQPSRLSFFLHPSRVPVSTPNSIDATAFVLDRYFNSVFTPAVVNFQVVPASGNAFTRQVTSRMGVAWTRMDSTPREGTVRVTAMVGNVQEPRVIQQVAAEACNLHMNVARSGSTVTLETDPVRDCSGNALPDGTIVSFTKYDHGGKTTVDTPIKKGIARTQFTANGNAQVSVACGVVLGNQVALN